MCFFRLLDQILEGIRRYTCMQVGISTADERVVVWTESNRYSSCGCGSLDDACSNTLGSHVPDIHCAYSLQGDIHESGPSLAINFLVLQSNRHSPCMAGKMDTHVPRYLSAVKPKIGRAAETARHHLAA